MYSVFVTQLNICIYSIHNIEILAQSHRTIKNVSSLLHQIAHTNQHKQISYNTSCWAVSNSQ